MNQPRKIMAILIVCQTLFFVFGDSYWLIGHSLVFFMACTLFGTAALDRLVPLKSEQDERNGVLRGNGC
jgi:hypothetical protein